MKSLHSALHCLSTTGAESRRAAGNSLILSLADERRLFLYSNLLDLLLWAREFARVSKKDPEIQDPSLRQENVTEPP